jgi:hypothetical protein
MHKLLKCLLVLGIIYYIYITFIEDNKEYMINIADEKHQMITFYEKKGSDVINEYVLITFRYIIMDDTTKYALELYRYITTNNLSFLYPFDENNNKIEYSKLVEEITYAMKQKTIHTYDQYTSEPLFAINIKDLAKFTNNTLVTGKVIKVGNIDPSKSTYMIDPYRTRLNTMDDIMEPSKWKIQPIEDTNMDYGISFVKHIDNIDYLAIANKTPNNPPAYLEDLRTAHLNYLTSLDGVKVYYISSKSQNDTSKLITLSISK